MKKVPLVFAMAMMLAVPAQAEEQKNLPDWDESQEMLEEGAKRVVGALELFLSAIPQYEMPEILPNGDILIRRKTPDNDTSPKKNDQDRT